VIRSVEVGSYFLAFADGFGVDAATPVALFKGREEIRLVWFLAFFVDTTVALLAVLVPSCLPDLAGRRGVIPRGMCSPEFVILASVRDGPA
jgi:hypothetical protein